MGRRCGDMDAYRPEMRLVRLLCASVNAGKYGRILPAASAQCYLLNIRMTHNIVMKADVKLLTGIDLHYHIIIPIDYSLLFRQIPVYKPVIWRCYTFPICLHIYIVPVIKPDFAFRPHPGMASLDAICDHYRSLGCI